MHVELLYHTPEPERAIAAAARLCYAPVSAAELKESMTEKQVFSVLNTTLGSGHTSVMEHASFTFAIDGVSRALTHQLVRHRLASYSQQSQRYVKFTDGVPTIKPQTIIDTPGAEELFDNAVAAAEDAYMKLVEMGIPAEDARYLLPNATETKIVVTMNARELMHFFNERCCKRAQWEIRDLANQMLALVKPVAPIIFAQAGAPCVKGGCPEGKMTCAEPYPKAEPYKLKTEA